ncbi:MAG: RNA 3'-terminal phosphate cyclase, partial [Planctomycetota bacterium]
STPPREDGSTDLTAVEAAARVGRARVEGATLGSSHLTFVPETVEPGDYRFDVGTAGSATLVLQAILPALLTAASPSHLILEGGTHNPFAPPFDFLDRAYLPLIRRMGPRVRAHLERPGFYPAGGGRFDVTVEPVSHLTGLQLLERGRVMARRAVARVAGLPLHIGEREIDRVGAAMGWGADSLAVENVKASRGPGNCLTIEIESDFVTEIFTGFGQRGVRAEAVADGAIQAARRYLESDVPAGAHLADQLLLPMALAGESEIRTLAPSRHTTTNLEVIEEFLGMKARITQEEPDVFSIAMMRA